MEEDSSSQKRHTISEVDLEKQEQVKGLEINSEVGHEEPANVIES